MMLNYRSRSSLSAPLRGRYTTQTHTPGKRLHYSNNNSPTPVVAGWITDILGWIMESIVMMRLCSALLLSAYTSNGRSFTPLPHTDVRPACPAIMTVYSTHAHNGWSNGGLPVLYPTYRSGVVDLS